MKPEAPDAKPISFPPCTSGPETFTHAIIDGELYKLDEPQTISVEALPGMLVAKEIDALADGRKRFWWLGRVITERKWKPWI